MIFYDEETICLQFVCINYFCWNWNCICEFRDKPSPLEESFPEYGYKAVDEAIKEFEHHFSQNLKLPLKVPPMEFTHYFGRFNDLDGDINDSLELKFINEKSPKNHFKIDVHPVKHKIPIRDRDVLEDFKLKNGNDATYIKVTSGFNALVFEKDTWQYILSVDKRVNDKITSEELVKIANSINYAKKN